MDKVVTKAKWEAKSDYHYENMAHYLSFIASGLGSGKSFAEVRNLALKLAGESVALADYLAEQESYHVRKAIEQRGAN